MFYFWTLGQWGMCFLDHWNILVVHAHENVIYSVFGKVGHSLSLHIKKKQ